MTRLEARVRAAIKSHDLVGDAGWISVSADEIGSVTLRGTLPTHLQSHSAARVARGVEGVLNVINKIDVKPLDAPRPPDAPPAVSAATEPQATEPQTAEPEPDAGPAHERAAKREGLDEEVQELLRGSEDVKRNEEQAEASISEEWRTEHWGRDPEHPPSWDKPGQD
jgi:hypothetical protein